MTQKPIFHKRGHLNMVQSIRAAASMAELAKLMVVASTFEHASDKTKSRWHEAVKIRRQELETL